MGLWGTTHTTVLLCSADKESVTAASGTVDIPSRVEYTFSVPAKNCKMFTTETLLGHKRPSLQIFYILHCKKYTVMYICSKPIYLPIPSIVDDTATVMSSACMYSAIMQ